MKKPQQFSIRFNTEEVALTLCALRYCEREGRQDLRPMYRALVAKMEAFT